MTTLGLKQANKQTSQDSVTSDRLGRLRVYPLLIVLCLRLRFSPLEGRDSLFFILSGGCAKEDDQPIVDGPPRLM